MAQEQPRPAPICGGDVIARSVAKHVIDGRTFVLDDGREVRLAAIEVAPLETGAAPAAAARAALDALIGGDDIVLRRADIATDRYGRLVAYAYAVRDGEELFAQGELIASGFARVGDHVGSRACTLALLESENAARAVKLGLWADSHYDVLDAETPRTCWRGEADLRWSRARWSPCGKRGHDLCEFRATLVRGFHRYGPETK